MDHKEKRNVVSDAAMRRISKNWSRKDWEEYLKTLEVERSETLVSPQRYDELREGNTFLWKNDSPQTKLYRINAMREALESLPRTQKGVLKMTFWHGVTEREIAKKFKMSKTWVRKQKIQGLKALKLIMMQRMVTTSPYIEDFLKISNF